MEDVLLTQLYRVEGSESDAASMRVGTVLSVDMESGTVSVDVAGATLNDVPFQAGMAPVVGASVWLIEQGTWFAVIGAGASTDQSAGLNEVAVSPDEPIDPSTLVWFDPTVNEEPPTVGGSTVLTYADIPAGNTDKDLAGLPRVQIDSPGVAGILMVWWSGYLWARTSGAPYPQISARDVLGSTDGMFSTVRASASSGTGIFPFVLMGSQPIEADQSVDLTLTGRYSTTTVPATLSRVEWGQAHTLFIPGAVRPGAPFSPARRYFDGVAWRPEGAAATDHVIAITPPPAKVASASTVTRSPGTTQVGSTVTLTSVVSGAGGTPAGTVTFYRSASPTGPWTSLGTAALDAGTATLAWKATEGSWWFRGVYGGSSVYSGSEDVTGNVCTVQAAKSEKVKAVSAAWVQAYNGSGDQISGSGKDDAVQQGYYSSTHGNRKSLLRFDLNLPADAEVQKVELLCSDWDHWFSSSGGTVVIGWHSRTSKPTTWTVGSGASGKSSHAVSGVGSWTVNISSWAKAAVLDSAFAGLTIGPGPSNSQSYYGYAGPGAGPWKLRVTYLSAT